MVAFDIVIEGKYDIEHALDDDLLTDAQKLLKVLNAFIKLENSYRVCNAEKREALNKNIKLRQHIKILKRNGN